MRWEARRRTCSPRPRLRDYLRACGIGDTDFARFADDRQMADEEVDVVRRIAVRLRDCPADSLRRLMAAELGGDNGRESAEVPSRADAKEHRGQAVRLRGRVESIEPAAETGWHVPEPGHPRSGSATGVFDESPRPSQAQGRATPRSAS